MKQFCKCMLAAALAAAATAAGAAEWRQREFAMRAFARLAPDGAAGFACSPWGTALALGALGYAADAETRAAYAKELGIYSEFPAAYDELRNGLEQDRFAADNNVASFLGIWTVRGLSGQDVFAEVQPEYTAAVQDSFGGEVIRSMYRGFANDLISVMTDGRFENFLKENEELDRNECSLTGAFAVRPRFQFPFKRGVFEKRKFRTPEGEKDGYRFMQAKMNAAFAETPAYQAAALPLKGNAALLIVKPKGDPAAFFKDFDANSLDDISHSLAMRAGDPAVPAELLDAGPFVMRTNDVLNVSFPAFSQKCSADLPAYFKAADLKSAHFEKLGRRSNMQFMRLETLVEFDHGGESGYGEVSLDESPAAFKPKVAAAAPAPALDPLREYERIRRAERAARNAPPPREFVCDSPFLYFICRNGSGFPLFAGRYSGE